MAAQAISKKTWLALALEATALTGANTTNLLYIPTKGAIQGIQHVEYPEEDRNTVDDHTTKQTTNREGTIEAKGSYYPDTSPMLLWTLLGAPATSQPDNVGSPTVYKHDIQLQDIPPTASAYKNWHQTTWFAVGAHMNKVQLKWDSKKLLEIDASGKCLFPTKYVGAPLTPAFTAIKPFSGYLPTITLGGASTQDIEDMSITFERKSELWFPSAATPDATRIDFGGRSAEVEFTARFDIDTFYSSAFISQTDTSVAVDFVGPLISGTYHQELNLSFGVVGIDDAKIDEGKMSVLVKFKGICRPDPANSDILVSGYAQNTVVAYAAS